MKNAQAEANGAASFMSSMQWTNLQGNPPWYDGGTGARADDEGDGARRRLTTTAPTVAPTTSVPADADEVAFVGNVFYVGLVALGLALVHVPMRVLYPASTAPSAGEQNPQQLEEAAGPPTAANAPPSFLNSYGMLFSEYRDDPMALMALPVSLVNRLLLGLFIGALFTEPGPARQLFAEHFHRVGHRPAWTLSSSDQILAPL